MTSMILTKTGLTGGTWQGTLTGAGDKQPTLEVTHLGQPVDGLALRHDPTNGAWAVEIPIPPHLINDGLQTFVISDNEGQMLNSFAFLAGDALGDDIRAEVDLLRSELDLLKKAFRQHCQDS